MNVKASKKYQIKAVEHVADIPFGWNAEGYAMHILSLGNPVQRIDTARGCLVLYQNTFEVNKNG